MSDEDLELLYTLRNDNFILDEEYRLALSKLLDDWERLNEAEIFREANDYC